MVRRKQAEKMQGKNTVEEKGMKSLGQDQAGALPGQQGSQSGWSTAAGGKAMRDTIREAGPC